MHELVHFYAHIQRYHTAITRASTRNLVMVFVLGRSAVTTRSLGREERTGH